MPKILKMDLGNLTESDGRQKAKTLKSYEPTGSAVYLQGVQDGLCRPCRPCDPTLPFLLWCRCLVLPERQYNGIPLLHLNALNIYDVCIQHLHGEAVRYYLIVSISHLRPWKSLRSLDGANTVGLLHNLSWIPAVVI